MLSKRLSNPLYYHSFSSWSGWPAVCLLQPSLHRQQNSALIKISWRWMSHIRTTSFVAPHDSADTHGVDVLVLIRLFITSVKSLISPKYHIKISPSTSEFPYYYSNPLHKHARFSWLWLPALWSISSLTVFVWETLSPTRLVHWTWVCGW